MEQEYKYCPRCGAEYHADIETCADCHIALTSAAIQRKERKTTRPTRLVFWVLLILIILLVIAIAIPNLLESKKGRSISASVYLLLQIKEAQDQYRSKHGTYATLEQLGAAKMIDNFPATGIKQGYSFTMTVNGGKWWYCVARPTEWDVTGEINYWISTNGVVRYNEEENSSSWHKYLHWTKE